MKQLLKYIISEKNPFAIIRRNKMRAEIKNINPTLLCPNCLGGILFHDLGLEFCSPTVNLMLTQTDFVKFVLNLKEFLNGSFEFFKHERETCPCAWLRTETGKEIVVHFTHYQSEQEAVDKWLARVNRINFNNMFICLLERDNLSEKEIRALGELNIKGLVVFTANNYEDIPYALQIRKFEKDGEVGNLLLKNYFDDSKVYEKYFDFVKWFNEADGADYDITRFAK